MPNQQKQLTIDEFSGKIEKSKAIIFTDYRGLTVNKVQQLKNKLADVNGEIQVTKNTLLGIALEKNGIKLDETLEGPTATIFAYGDEVSPIKTLIDFAKENNDLPNLKFGLLAKKNLNLSQLKILSQLPSREVLYAQLVGTLVAPITKLMYGLNYHNQSFINVLNNIKDKKSN